MPKKRPSWATPRGAERAYAGQLRKVARIVAGIIRNHIDGAELIEAAALREQVAAYSKALEPWAKKVAGDMLSRVNNDAKRAFFSAAKTISKELRGSFMESAAGEAVRQLQAAQVELIKSIPMEAAQRAQRLALEAATGGKRADEVAAELMRTEDITLSRATLIARTETSKANSMITQARAKSVESPGYIWRTMQDGATRESHAEMEGEFVRWDEEPTLSDGNTHHAGQFPNCRCYAEPILPEWGD